MKSDSYTTPFSGQYNLFRECFFNIALSKNLNMSDVPDAPETHHIVNIYVNYHYYV